MTDEETNRMIVEMAVAASMNCTREVFVDVCLRGATAIVDIRAQLAAANARADHAEAQLAVARDAALVDASAVAIARKGNGEATLDHPYDRGYLAACDSCAAAILALRDKPAPAVTVEDSFSTLVAEARAEAEKAMRKFPQPNYVLLKVAEEAGEVVKAAVHFAEGRETVDNVRSEMRQTIAMLYRLWIEGDEVNGVRAIAGGGDE